MLNYDWSPTENDITTELMDQYKLYGAIGELKFLPGKHPKHFWCLEFNTVEDAVAFQIAYSDILG